ncbi:amidase family protein [Cupriavidus sp. CV2]|uniref:amidase family protein n=1 Tax=Cupriavidus ulmosensis TaxID=3065913 RepID=UPI00296B1AC0|nr:amidase family protein [Cupriavidus sp. CV2]MDW3688051.1 amidase family protein [Cupriavidus sp. CV2]
MAVDLHSAAGIAAQIRTGNLAAQDVVRASLARAVQVEPLNCVSLLLAEQARTGARACDTARLAGEPSRPLVGVPFVVKNLLDMAGHVTLAGAHARASDPPATSTAAVVQALMAAGAIPVALTQMDEYACGATGENVIGGPVRNPLDPARIAGGSSAGTAAAIAAGVAPVGIGSDTNGSIRAPASFCGIWGLRPTTGRISTQGCFPYAESLDAVGPMASDATGLALAYRAMLGAGPATGEPMPAAGASMAALRVGILQAGFGDFAQDEAQDAVLRVASAFGSARMIDLPEADLARDAASIISAFEVGRNHFQRGFAERHPGYSAFVRQRMLAGLAIPESWYRTAKAYQAVWRAKLEALFDEVDLLLACTTPYAAPLIGMEQIAGSKRTYAPRADAGHLTRPVSLAGLPVVAAPCAVAGMPLGVQLIAPAWQEERCLDAALFLEAQGLCRNAQAGSYPLT